MSTNGPTAPEEQYTALFAAAEEGAASDQAPPLPADTPAWLRSRLERDLAFARLLRATLRRPPAGPAPPERVGPAWAAGGPGPDGELRALLHRGLRIGGLVFTTANAYLALMALRRAALDPNFFREYGGQFPLTWVVLVLGALVTALLWGKRSFSWGRLRTMEVLLVGLFLADRTWALLYDLAFAGRLAELQGLARAPGQAEELVFHYACRQGLCFAVVIICYATLVPSGWRRCTLVVGAVALTPLVLSTAAGLVAAPAPAPFLFSFTLPLAILLAIAVVVAAVGSRRVEVLRQGAFEARRLGQYRLKRRLGSGGMGEVYLAEHALLKQPCALKLIRPERAGDSATLRRFEREVRATARLKHPNTVQIYDYGHTEDGTFYYVMEYLPGLTLEQLVRQHGPLPPARAVYLLRQVCLALREAHLLGLVHRDVKPANLLVCERGGLHDVVKVLDFGLVKGVGREGDEDKLTQEGAIAGTPAYLSPEQAGGQEGLDARSDLYSLGAVAYFLLTGRPPFVRARRLQTIVAHLQDPVRPLAELRPEVPADVQDVVLRCLEKDPARRFPDAGSLHDALRACRCAGGWGEEQAAGWWRTQVRGCGASAQGDETTPAGMVELSPGPPDRRRVPQ